MQFYESRTYVFMTSHTIRLSPETPTPNPAPRGGELFWARFFGAKAPKNRAIKFPPSPREGGSGGMGLPTKPPNDLCEAVLVTAYCSLPFRSVQEIPWLIAAQARTNRYT